MLGDFVGTRTWAYQGVKNVCFSENFGCFVFLKHSFWDSPFCLITDDLTFRHVLTSNHMFGKAILDKMPECIFENFEIFRAKRGQFQNFQKSRGWFIPKIVQTMDAQTKHVITDLSHQTNKHFVLKLISFNSGQLQNNTGNGAMSITINHVTV